MTKDEMMMEVKRRHLITKISGDECPVYFYWHPYIYGYENWRHFSSGFFNGVGKGNMMTTCNAAINIVEPSKGYKNRYDNSAPTELLPMYFELNRNRDKQSYAWLCQEDAVIFFLNVYWHIKDMVSFRKNMPIWDSIKSVTKALDELQQICDDWFYLDKEIISAKSSTTTV